MYLVELVDGLCVHVIQEAGYHGIGLRATKIETGPTAPLPFNGLWRPGLATILLTI